MVDSESSTAIQDITEFDKYINYVKLQYATNREPVGIEIDNSASSPTVQRIDRNGEPFTPDADFFHNHEIWGSMYLCTLTPGGVPTYKLLPNGEGLDLTGAAGDLMVRQPNIQCRYELDGTKQRFWAAPFDSNHPYYNYHPHCYSGGTLHDHFFGGAYEASMGVDASGNKILRSITGAQPWTGGELRSLAFTSGGPTAFTKGEQLTGATSGATGYIVDFYVSSGTWAGGDAAGTVYLSLPGVAVSTATAFVNNDILMTGVDPGFDSATASGAATALPLTIDDALAYAANKGTGWTITDINARSLIQLLYYIQTGTRNSQTASGQGISNFLLGSGFAGKDTGSDSIDTRVDPWGNGIGDGLDGQVAVSYNNYRNLWGNCWEMVSGINIMADRTCRVTNRDYAGTIAGTLPEGSYETLYGTVPSIDGYISKIQTGDRGALIFAPLLCGGSSSTEFCDSYYQIALDHEIVLSGGGWAEGSNCGLLTWNTTSTPLNSDFNAGCRLKFIPQS